MVGARPCSMAAAKCAMCALLLACVGPTTAFTRAPTITAFTRAATTTAFTRAPTPLHGRAPTALRASPEEDAAVACCKVKSPADEATVRANFRALAAKSGDAAALVVARNSGQSMRWDAARVGAAFDAWTARFDGDAAQAGDLVGKNPGLLYCRPAGKDGIENAPLDQAVAIANAMDFFRFGR